MTKKKKPVDDEFLPVIEGAKFVGVSAVRGAKILVGSLFPSHDAQVRREEGKLRSLEKRIELLKLQRKMEVKLKELEKAEEE